MYETKSFQNLIFNNQNSKETNKIMLTAGEGNGGDVPERGAHSI